MRNIIKRASFEEAYNCLDKLKKKKPPYLYPLKNKILIQNSKSGFIY